MTSVSDNNPQHPPGRPYYCGEGKFIATDTNTSTTVHFFSTTTTLTNDDVVASFAHIGYNIDGSPIIHNRLIHK